MGLQKIETRDYERNRPEGPETCLGRSNTGAHIQGAFCLASLDNEVETRGHWSGEGDQFWVRKESLSLEPAILCSNLSFSSKTLHRNTHVINLFIKLLSYSHVAFQCP